MMKRIGICLAILGVVALSANAGMIKALAPTGTNTTSMASALSDDGTLVGGGSGTNPVSWDMTDPNNPVATVVTSFASGTGTKMTGIGKSGTNVYTSGTGTYQYYGDTTTWTGLRRTSTTYDKMVIGGYNSTATTGTDQWIAGGNTNSTGPAYLWQRSNGSLPKYAVAGTTGAQAKFNSVAAFGTSVRAVGYDTVGNKIGVYSNDGGALTRIPKVSDANYNSVEFDGQANGISVDGAWIVGNGKPTGPGGKAPTYSASYRWNYGTATSELLQPLEGMTNVFLPLNDPLAVQAIAYDVASDGLVVGSSWSAATGDRGAIWLPGETTPRLLLPYLGTLGIQTATAWNLDNSINTGWTSLGRTFSTTKVGDNYVITGDGTYMNNNVSTARAFYVVIPEPATLIFLSLGGLFLRRRRTA